MYKISYYKVLRGESPVEEFIDKMNEKDQAKVYNYLKLLQDKGYLLIRPYTAKVRGKLRELRVRIEEGNVRIFYFFFVEKKIILLHAFKKKVQALPAKEINKAENNMKDFIKMYGKRGNRLG